MVTKTIPLTRFADYVATAKKIQQMVGASAPAGADLHQVVADLADLAVKALEEAHHAIEGLVALVMALHPEATRMRPRRKA
jgi:hypothetical protein